MKTKSTLAPALVCGLGLTFTSPMFAQDEATDDKAAAAELAKKLQNPVANLISGRIRTGAAVWAS